MPDEEKDTRNELMRKITKCLNEHGGKESNIGIPHPYWSWIMELRVAQ